MNGGKAAVWGREEVFCFLNTVDAADVFARAVDINPDRQGRHISRSGQRIFGASELQPDGVFIINPLSESEIRPEAL